MRRSPRVRAAASVAAAGLLLAGLTGCFLLPQLPPLVPGSPAGGGTAAHPEVGDCWNTTYDDMAAWSNWEGDDPVDCHAEHQSYTFYAGALTTEVEDGWDGSSISDELAGAISEQCYPIMEKEFGLTDRQQLVGLFFFVAPKSDWEDGDHSIRCDVALTKIGSDYYAPELGTLPADIGVLKSDIDDNPRGFELCLTGDGLGPYESTELSYADCAGDYLWRYAGLAQFDDGPDAAYPSDDDLYGFADAACADLGPEGAETVYPYVPLADGWKDGDRSIECWFSLVDTPSTAL